jgi:hypothetical protein
MTVPPYAGLTPFSEADAGFFFGREREEDVLLANLTASRLPILYGAMGVGKSSLLRAGLARRLRSECAANLADYGVPKLAPVLFGSWGAGDPVEKLRSAIQAAAAELMPHLARSSGAAPSRLDETIEASAQRVEGKVLVILDQFEEYFLYQRGDERDGGFAVELARAVNRPDLPVGFLICIRDDAVAKLIPLRELIPRLLDNFQHLEHLDREAARAAIIGPLEAYNRSARAGEELVIEPELVEAVLDEVRGPTLDLWSEPGETRVDTSLLQVVMMRLWAEETRLGSHALRLETLERLGHAERIVAGAVEGPLAALAPEDQRLVAEILHYLVTPSGMTIAHTARDLALFTKTDEQRLVRVLAQLSSARILRREPPAAGQLEIRFRVHHDVLVVPLREWAFRQSYVARRRSKLFRFLSRR